MLSPHAWLILYILTKLCSDWVMYPFQIYLVIWVAHGWVTHILLGQKGGEFDSVRTTDLVGEMMASTRKTVTVSQVWKARVTKAQLSTYPGHLQLHSPDTRTPPAPHHYPQLHLMTSYHRWLALESLELSKFLPCHLTFS